MKAEVGDRIVIVKMEGEVGYNGKTGVVEKIDDLGGLHGTWGWLAVLPEYDEFRII